MQGVWGRIDDHSSSQLSKMKSTAAKLFRAVGSPTRSPSTWGTVLLCMALLPATVRDALYGSVLLLVREVRTVDDSESEQFLADPNGSAQFRTCFPRFHARLWISPQALLLPQIIQNNTPSSPERLPYSGPNAALINPAPLLAPPSQSPSSSARGSPRWAGICEFEAVAEAGGCRMCGSLTRPG